MVHTTAPKFITTAVLGLALLACASHARAQPAAPASKANKESKPSKPGQAPTDADLMAKPPVPSLLDSKPTQPLETEMVSVPGGPFWFGCNDKVDERCDADERPGRRVELPAFRIDRTEVTVKAFARCVNARVCTDEGLGMPYWNNRPQLDWKWACNWRRDGKDDHPINCVNWVQAETYCRFAGKRLPTEQEWEKAARGTDGAIYPWGNAEFPDTGNGKALPVANIADTAAKSKYPTWAVLQTYSDGFIATSPVSAFPRGASPYGADDMIGNVFEWTSDDWKNNPALKMFKGGSWGSLPSRSRVSTRAHYTVQPRTPMGGFRCAQSAGASVAPANPSAPTSGPSPTKPNK
jgi:formylglycine-generating enzyme required for sulfatase activity